MSIRHGTFLGTMLVLELVMVAHEARAADSRMFDPTMAWPLCGRIAETPPAGWNRNRGCPVRRWGNPDFSDFPLATTFGPRIMPTDSNRYDFHRGIDIATATGTPVFAVAAGIVQVAGNSSRYSNPLITIQHYRPGNWDSCSPGGCYHSLYMHVSGWVVAAGQEVRKGQLIGYSGASDAGFEHLHFELRDAPASDPESNWNQDAIHPLSVLPYYSDISATQVQISNVDTSNPQHPIVTALVRQPAAAKTWDVQRVEVEVYDNRNGALISQPGNTPDAHDYHINPPWLDLEIENRKYTHKDSSSVPWSSFATCPHASAHPTNYDGDIHLGQTDANDVRTGTFNGIRRGIERYSQSSQDYRLTLEFRQVVGTSSASDLCIIVHATNVRSERSVPATWNCTF